MRRLIVNADDFGLTPGVNQAVVELHRAGALTSATLMASTSHFQQAAALAQQNPSLGVGCHVVLVDGTPVSPPETIRTLLDPLSRVPAFRTSLPQFVQDLLLGRIDAREMQMEAEAQIRRVQSSGVSVTHIDTHKHTHMFPRVLEPLLRASAACGVTRIRNPFEPEWSVRATPQAGTMRRLEVRLLRTMRQKFLTLTHEYRIATTGGCLGVLATGTLNAKSIEAILDPMPEGTWEFVCHPGYMDAELRATRTWLTDSRAVETQALLDTLGQSATKHADMILTNFGNLNPY